MQFKSLVLLINLGLFSLGWGAAGTESDGLSTATDEVATIPQHMEHMDSLLKGEFCFVCAFGRGRGGAICIYIHICPIPMPILYL